MIKRNKKRGLPPGSVVFTGSQKVDTILIHHLKYDQEKFENNILDNHKDIIFQKSADEIVDWYDIRGMHDTNLIEAIGQAFEIHPLVLEDIADINQRPKFEEYDNGIFITFRALTFSKTTYKVQTEQVSLFFRKGLALSFQETESDLFEVVRDRISSGRGRIRSRGSDYLVYSIIDSMVDNYYAILESVEEVIEALEESMLLNLEINNKNKIHSIKKEMLIVRKSIAPLREAISRFLKSEHPCIEEKTLIFVRDLYDHTIQVMDMVETYRDVLNGLQDLFLSETSFRMNQVMQTLTIVSAIFIPLSFLAGLYGMNFEHIPELHFRYGYFILLGFMASIFVSLLFYFRKRKWL